MNDHKNTSCGLYEDPQLLGAVGMTERSSPLTIAKEHTWGGVGVQQHLR